MNQTEICGTPASGCGSLKKYSWPLFVKTEFHPGGKRSLWYSGKPSNVGESGEDACCMNRASCSASEACSGVATCLNGGEVVLCDALLGVWSGDSAGGGGAFTF